MKADLPNYEEYDIPLETLSKARRQWLTVSDDVSKPLEALWDQSHVIQTNV